MQFVVVISLCAMLLSLSSVPVSRSLSLAGNRRAVSGFPSITRLLMSSSSSAGSAGVGIGQSKTETKSYVAVGLRLEQLRAMMKEQSPPVDAFIIPTDDPHMSEYTAPWYARREYLSGFTGSAGTAVVTQDSAALFTDGRYHNQAALELDDKHWQLMKSGLQGVPSIQQYVINV